MGVLHACDNPACVRPDHLFLGTTQENMKDRNNKGRTAHGEGHGRAKLTDADVRVIRASPLSQAELARMFNVHPNAVRNARVGITWKHVN